MSKSLESRSMFKLKNRLNQYTNDLTRVMDKYLIEEIDSFSTYVYCCDQYSNTCILRYPGRTIGYIEADEHGVITKIELYDECFAGEKLYKEGILDAIAQFIGYNIMFMED